MLIPFDSKDKICNRPTENGSRSEDVCGLFEVAAAAYACGLRRRLVDVLLTEEGEFELAGVGEIR
jgi:hypothetical protein